MKNIINIVCLAALLASCEKIIDLDYTENQSQIIIEGNITNEEGPYFVRITESIGISETGMNPTVDNAKVTIGDDAGNSETLTPEGNGYYRTTSIQGEEGRSYFLTVDVDGQVYTAESTMPQNVPFDSIRVEELELFGELQYTFVPVYHDPAEAGNYYRFKFALNNELLKQHLIQSDEIRNGQVNTLLLLIDDEELELKAGDMVTLTMQCVDQNVGSYYRALVEMSNTGPGGGTTPANPPNNITGGALGVFSAHTTQTRNAVLQ